MKRSNLERLREAKRKSMPVQELESLDAFLELLCGGPMLPTQRDFIYSPERIRGYMGPAGCAKTSTLCAAALMRALFQPGSKGLCARFDYNDLMDTTVQRMDEMLRRLPSGTLLDRDKSPPMKWWVQPVVDGDPSQITFMGLKEYMGSYEFNWAAIDEADEVDEKVVAGVDSRLRAPDPSNSYALLMAFNPPAKTHWLYPACTGLDVKGRKAERPAWVKLFLPRPNENLANLPSDYYERLAKSLPDDMRQRLVEGQWGSTFLGAPVYREFKYGLHAKPLLDFDPYSTLFRFWDFGYNTPACLWAQLDAEGRLLILAEEIGQQTEVQPFAQRCKGITATLFPGVQDVIDYGDPAARQKKDTGSTVAALLREGIVLRYRICGIDPGLRAVRQLLQRLINGEPAVQIHRRCLVLVDGLKGGYRMDDANVKPFKDGHYEHVMDAFRYGVVNLFGPVEERAMGATPFQQLPDSIAYSRGADQGLVGNFPTLDEHGFRIEGALPHGRIP